MQSSMIMTEEPEKGEEADAVRLRADIETDSSSTVIKGCSNGTPSEDMCALAFGLCALISVLGLVSGLVILVIRRCTVCDI